jgi:hypothetical protein
MATEVMPVPRGAVTDEGSPVLSNGVHEWRHATRNHMIAGRIAMGDGPEHSGSPLGLSPDQQLPFAGLRQVAAIPGVLAIDMPVIDGDTVRPPKIGKYQA